MSENKPATVPSVDDVVRRPVPGVDDQVEWNARISEMQDGLEFEPLIEFLEGLKEVAE